MSNLTCLNCNVRFKTNALHKEHYKSDWHRYNLKRKIGNLPPVSADNFKKILLDQQNDQSSSLEDESMYCRACGKLFKSSNALKNHLGSKKHTDTLREFLKTNEESDIIVKATGISAYAEERAAMDDDSDVEEVDSDEWEEDCESPLGPNDCLFCDVPSADLTENIKHMSVEHSFFIPDAEYCTDVEGLLNYLGVKVCRDFICLWCNYQGRSFYTLAAVRKHMHDKCHCRMLYEGSALAEYIDYYDYSTSYPDHQENMEVDEELDNSDLLDGDEYKLILPSGIAIGHRSLLRYYKQKLRPTTAVVPKKSDRKMHRILAEYRSIGWNPTNHEMAIKNAKDIQYMKRKQAKLYQKLGCKANKLQKHFRQQILQ